MVTISREGCVLRVTLARPEKRNALNLTLCRALLAAIEGASHDPEIVAILLTAEGPAFCAGMDLTEIEIGGDSVDMDAVHEGLFSLGARIATPMIAAVRGPALGGGVGLVANCHIVVASEDANFGLTEIRHGLWPFLIFQCVSAAVGERRTVELSLTGRVFPATEAREIGLVHELAKQPEERALEFARAVAEFSPVALAGGLAFVNRIRGIDAADASEIARAARKRQFEGDDFREGIRAFREKRPRVGPLCQNYPLQPKCCGCSTQYIVAIGKRPLNSVV
jgi:enoyl-CoA hydratase/carnithine racemase